jgi:hypothetical protein
MFRLVVVGSCGRARTDRVLRVQWTPRPTTCADAQATQGGIPTAFQGPVTQGAYRGPAT